MALGKDSIVNCDETWCQVRKYDHYKKCYIWVLVNKVEQTVIFFYEDGSRGRDVLTHFIGDAELKSLMSDGYNTYVFIVDELKVAEISANLGKVTHQVCLAHARAKFVKTSKLAGDHNADIFQEYINRLYDLERLYDNDDTTSERRVELRQGLVTKKILIILRQYIVIERKTKTHR